MKKVIYYTVLLLMITAVSCIEKKTEPAKNEILEQHYSIDIDNTVLNWTAYKTTDKIPVKGVFQEVKIRN